MKKFGSTFRMLLVVILLMGLFAVIGVVSSQSPDIADSDAVLAPDAPSSLLFSYQGQLLDSSDSPITDPAVDMTFKLYDVAELGTACWSEDHTGADAVDVQDGLFNMLLGSMSSIDTACLTGDVYLELAVEGETMSPRELLTSVIHAQEAGTLPDGATTQGELTVSGDVFTERLASPINTDLTIDAGSGSLNTLTLHDDVHISGSVTCGAYIEANLQTESELAAAKIERFEEGDVLCWSPTGERLELCGGVGDPLVMAVAAINGKPIVLGAELIKILGPVAPGDLLVSSETAGYAVAWSQLSTGSPPVGIVIAKALEAFDGDQGVIKAMIMAR